MRFRAVLFGIRFVCAALRVRALADRVRSAHVVDLIRCAIGAVRPDDDGDVRVQGCLSRAAMISVRMRVRDRKREGAIICVRTRAHVHMCIRLRMGTKNGILSHLGAPIRPSLRRACCALARVFPLN